MGMMRGGRSFDPISFTHTLKTRTKRLTNVKIPNNYPRPESLLQFFSFPTLSSSFLFRKVQFSKSQGKVEHKARSILAALYSNADINLFSSLLRSRSRRAVPTSTPMLDAWRHFGADIYYCCSFAAKVV
jgi:hypothetical protein